MVSRTRYPRTAGRILQLALLQQQMKELVAAGFYEYVPALKLARDEAAFEDLDMESIRAITRAARNLVNRATRASSSPPAERPSRIKAKAPPMYSRNNRIQEKNDPPPGGPTPIGDPKPNDPKPNDPPPIRDPPLPPRD